MASLPDQWRNLKERRVKDGLSKVYERTPLEVETLDAARDRWVIFSDHHKGGRDPADDFWRCEAAYRAALGFYLELGFKLVVLGDAEELWESSPDVVLDRYSETLQLEGAFATEGGYARVWGNHDPNWSGDSTSTKPLATSLGLKGDLDVREAFRVPVTAGNESGELFLVHGHQGTLSSDLLARVSKPLVRYGWANLQRLINRPWNTPAQDSALRAHHDKTMWEWAEARSGLVLIAGHTHRPVFRSEQRPPPDINLLRSELDNVPREPARRAERAGKRAALEAAKARARTTPDLRPIEMHSPCYFNTGCASFGDGSVTALEVSDGQIQLVRWPWPYGDQQPRRDSLLSANLGSVLAAVGTGGKRR